MPSRSLARSAAFCAATALALVSAVAAASPPPEVPPVVAIPVAPLPKPRKVVPAAAVATPPPTTTTTVTTTTVTTPALAAVEVEPSPAPARGATEAMPPAPPAAAPRVLLVDEAPFKVSRTRARELPEHEHEQHGRHAKKGRHGRLFHPAPGIVVEVSSAQGGSAADLQRAARNVGYWPIRHCYEEGLRRNQQLGGSISFELGRQSSDAATQLTESTVHDESVTQCVLREARHLQLPWGEGGGETMADVKVTLATGDEPVPTPHAVPHADELREALHASWPAVQQCYASELAKHPDTGGRMELRFRAKSSGEILEISEDEPRFGDVEVTRCVLGVYRTAKLPHLHGSHAGTFVYALHLESAPAALPAAK